MQRHTKGGYETLLILIIALTSTLLVSGLPWKGLPKLTSPGDIVQQITIVPKGTAQNGIQAKTLDIQTTWAPTGGGGLVAIAKTLVNILQSSCDSTYGTYVFGKPGFIFVNGRIIFMAKDTCLIDGTPQNQQLRRGIPTGANFDVYDELNANAVDQTNLQCVGFARAISDYLPNPEQRLKLVGTAADYATGSPGYTFLNYAGQRPQVGDFTIYSHPHIAYVIDASRTGSYDVAQGNIVSIATYYPDNDLIMGLLGYLRPQQ